MSVEAIVPMSRKEFDNATEFSMGEVAGLLRRTKVAIFLAINQGRLKADYELPADNGQNRRNIRVSKPEFLRFAESGNRKVLFLEDTKAEQRRRTRIAKKAWRTRRANIQLQATA